MNNSLYIEAFQQTIQRSRLVDCQAEFIELKEVNKDVSYSVKVRSNGLALSIFELDQQNKVVNKKIFEKGGSISMDIEGDNRFDLFLKSIKAPDYIIMVERDEQIMYFIVELKSGDDEANKQLKNGFLLIPIIHEVIDSKLAEEDKKRPIFIGIVARNLYKIIPAEVLKTSRTSKQVSMDTQLNPIEHYTSYKYFIFNAKRHGDTIELRQYIDLIERGKL